MRQLLQLHPHSHTGKVLHHKHTSYHAVFLIVGLAGVFMVFLSSAAKAADYVVTASIPAPIPSGAPVITAPADGTVTSTANVTVSGSCPISTPPIIISIVDQNGFLGSQQCSNGGTFSIPVTLSLGVHHLTATVTTITGDNGASSQPVTITYAIGGTHHPSSSAPTTSPLQISSDTDFIVFGPTSDAIWRGSFSGGTPPYTVTVDWGDGSSDIFSNRASEAQVYTHHYHHLMSYRVTLLVTDATGQSISRSIAAISPATFSQPTVGAGVIASNNQLITHVLYGVYGGLFSLLLLFWHYEHGRHLAQAMATSITTAKSGGRRQ